MSLDNVLAIAGTARDHFWVLVTGLLLSVALMGVASELMARLMRPPSLDRLDRPRDRHLRRAADDLRRHGRGVDAPAIQAAWPGSGASRNWVL